MKIVRIIYWVLIIVCIEIVGGCQDDLFDQNNGVDVNAPVLVDLSFGVPRSSEIIVTRADNSESDIYGIRIYIFNGDKYLGMREIGSASLFDSSEDESGHRYIAKDVSLYKGTQTIYAVANITRTGYFEDATGLLNSLEEEAQKGKTNFLNKLYALASGTINGGNLPQFTTKYMPLSGFGEVTVNSSTNVTGSVSLKRLVAQINFKINTERTNKNGDLITFTPQSYTFYNVPEQGLVMENTDVISNGLFYNTVPVVIGGASGNDKQAYFSVYVPENIQNAKKACASYNNREAFDGTGTNKNWTYAPDHGMYVVLKGKYTQTSNNSLEKYADVEYTIHLGDFSNKNYDNFSVLRNNIYTYTVTVTGVENIIVEAKREDLLQNSAEGDVVELTEASKMFNLDSHYEQVYVEYDLTNIANSIQMGEGTDDEDLKERIALNFILSIHTPFNIREASEELVTPYNSNLSEQEGMKGIDYKWLEFLPQETSLINPYPGQNSEKLLSAWEVCQKMGEAVFQLKKGNQPDSSIFTNTNGHWLARFTIFVDEYFYAQDLEGKTVAWESYTHVDPRTMLIASDMKISEDLNSTYSVALTYITQTSMETFYNGAASDTYNAMGIETYNENGPIEGFGKPNNPGWGFTNQDPSMGRANTLVNICGSEDINSKQIEWKKYIDWSKVGYSDDNTTSKNRIDYNKHIAKK